MNERKDIVNLPRPVENTPLNKMLGERAEYVLDLFKNTLQLDPDQIGGVLEGMNYLVAVHTLRDMSAQERIVVEEHKDELGQAEKIIGAASNSVWNLLIKKDQ